MMRTRDIHYLSQPKSLSSQELLDAGRTGGACAQLSTVFERTEGGFPPPDFVEGEAAPEVAARVQTLLSDLGCER